MPSKENITSLSALEVAEQMTYLDQKIMFTIMSSEFLEQAWLKSEKAERSPNIVVMTKRFNDVSFFKFKDPIVYFIVGRSPSRHKWEFYI